MAELESDCQWSIEELAKIAGQAGIKLRVNLEEASLEIFDSLGEGLKPCWHFISMSRLVSKLMIWKARQ